MPRILALTLKLMLISGVHETDQGALISFEAGERGTLPVSEKNYRYYVALAQRALSRQNPVGVELSDGTLITRMGRADSDFVIELADRESEVSVYFQGHDGIFHLRHDHPRFQLLKDLLARARDSKKRVWFTSGQGNVLEDAMEFGAGVQPHQ